MLVVGKNYFAPPSLCSAPTKNAGYIGIEILVSKCVRLARWRVKLYSSTFSALWDNIQLSKPLWRSSLATPLRLELSPLHPAFERYVNATRYRAVRAERGREFRVLLQRTICRADTKVCCGGTRMVFFHDLVVTVGWLRFPMNALRSPRSLLNIRGVFGEKSHCALG